MDSIGTFRFYRDSAGFLREYPSLPAASSPASSASAPAITSTFSMAQAGDGNSPTFVVPGPVSLVSVDAYNARTGGVSILFFDKATAPIVGTDVPRWTVYLPALTPANRVYPTGIRFPTGLTFALVADDVAGLMAGDIRELNLGYSV